MREVQLPGTRTHGVQFRSVVKEESLVGRYRTPGSEHERADILAVDRLCRQLAAGEPGDRGQQIDGTGDLVAILAGGDLAGPAHDARHAHAPFKGCELAAAQRAGGARMVAVGQIRPVVRGEDHQGVVIQAVLFEGSQNLAHRPVQLLDHVAVDAAGDSCRETSPKG